MGVQNPLSGLMTINDSRHLSHIRESQTQNSRSVFLQAPVGVSPSQNGKLLLQGQVFEGQFVLIPEQRSERGHQTKEDFHHGC